MRNILRDTERWYKRQCCGIQCPNLITGNNSYIISFTPVRVIVSLPFIFWLWLSGAIGSPRVIWNSNLPPDSDCVMLTTQIHVIFPPQGIESGTPTIEIELAVAKTKIKIISVNVFRTLQTILYTLICMSHLSVNFIVLIHLSIFCQNWVDFSFYFAYHIISTIILF